jgi:two-component system LytT family response regulator
MLSVLIVDDESPARKRLRKLLSPMAEDERLKIVGEAGDGIEALERLQQQDIDLVFLDIRMPGLDGFDVLERLEPEHRPTVVFTTAYDAYAIRAFEASATDYLLKPVSKERATGTRAR